MILDPTTKNRSHKPVMIARQLLLSLAGLSMLLTAVFFMVLYVRQKTALIENTDRTLGAITTLLRETLPADYHDKITGPSSVSDSEYQKIVDRNNRLCVALGVEYIWSLMEVDGRIVFTTATSPDKVADNRKHAKFFEAHSNPEFYIPTFESMQPTFKTCHDKWGDLRVALIPYYDNHGRKCLFGACYKMADIDRALRAVVRNSLLIGVVFFGVSMLVGVWITRRITRPIKQLTATIQGVGEGKRDLLAAECGSYEQVTLARQFNRMNRALQDKILELEAAHSELTELFGAERKQSKAQLGVCEQRYQNLLNFAADGIMVGTHEGIVCEVNECMCMLFGMERNDVMGKHIREMPFTPESVRRTPFRFDLIQEGKMVVSERTIRRPDGSEIIVEMHSKMMADGSYQSSYRDITERKRTEETLTETRRLLDEA